MDISYKSYLDLSNDILNNLNKISFEPHLIVGIPRSGMVPSYYLSNLLNVPCLTLQEFKLNTDPFYGVRKLKSIENFNSLKQIDVLLVDDSIFDGYQISKIIMTLPETYKNIKIIYHIMFVYTSGKEISFTIPSNIIVKE
ncbi:MAG: hypothetical protein IJU40_03820, partial [Desulfovibrionaceae bacterium]|nr:hypothetical protein [Desulfovibrionaceae bacterium]